MSSLALIALFILFGAQASARTFTVGVVPQFEARKLHATWRPLLDELARTTGHRFELLGNSSIPEFEASYAAGEFDLIYSNPWHAVIANELQGYLPIVHDRARKLRGVLVIPTASNITDVTELRGQEIAFPSPNALGASLLMRADLKRIFGIDIIPVYVDTHSSVYLNVALGTTAAGGGVMRTLNEQPENIRQRLKVLYQTRAMPPHPISVHPRVTESDRMQIQQALVKLGAQPNSQQLFADIPMEQPSITSIEEYLELESWGLRDFYVTD